jgi:tyrosine-protein kinase Etk/Wzc
MNMQSSRKYRKENDPRFTDLRTILAKYFYHWPLFLIWLLLSLGVAIIYVKITAPVREVSATILVKDDKKVPQEKSALQEIDQSASPKNAETEMQILKSTKLMGRVVNDLKLWIQYTEPQFLSSKDLYDTTPVDFSMLQNTESIGKASLKVTIISRSNYQIEDASGNKQTLKFNQVNNNGIGRWVLKPTKYIGNYIGKTIIVAINQPDVVTNGYVKQIDVHLLDKATPTIGLFLGDKVPARGKKILNYMIRAYNDETSSEERRATESTIRFINDRLASLTGELNTAEKNVEGYRSSQGLTDIDSQSKVYLENVQSNDSKLNEVNVQLNVIEGIEHYVNSNSNNENPPATIGISDPALNSLIEKVAQLQLKKSALLATTPAGNPVFEPINQQIQTTKNAIRQTIQSIKSSLLTTKRELQSFNNRFESSIKNIPGQERQFVGMKRQQSIKENLYVYLLQKKEEISLSYAATLADARIVDQATVGDVIWPTMPFIAAIALIAGLGIPFLTILLRDSMRNKITSKKEIESQIDVRVLNEFNNHDLSEKIITDANHVIGEQFKSLRTNLHYLHNNVKGRGRVTLLTSSISNEGKSFISSNLAATLAQAGRRTVILEMDLRKPKISKTFELPETHPGISNYLSSDIEVSNIIQHSKAIPGLDIIGSGEIPPNPSELLEKDRLEQLINWLRENYDDVIIDSPPLHLVTDAFIIARVSDVTLYVVRQGYTSKAEIDFISDVQEDGKMPNLNILFNGVTSGKYGYGYNYDTSYYTVNNKRSLQRNLWKSFSSRL